jgi:hypothetical protein
MSRSAIALSVLSTLALLAVADMSWAGVESGREVLWDFTQPDTIVKLVRWSDTNYLKATANGLGWNGGANESRDVTIETRKPVAVGWSWHPVTTVNVSAEIVPAGEFSFGPNSITFPVTAGVLYARYSPDGGHWSTWQALELQEPRDHQKPRLFFAGTVRVPQRARQDYAALLRQFAGTDRPVAVDEEVAVVWVLKKEPDFFKKELPFIGFVEFLWEAQIRGDQRVRQVKIHLGYGRSGHLEVPRGHDDVTPWRFQAPASKSR